MTIKTKETLKDKIKIDKAYLNYNKIIEKQLPYKFSYLDEWALKKSKKLLKEAEILEKSQENKFRVFKRGTIIKVDFGVGLGSEMSQVHFAIVLNNFDNPKNNVLTVLPLTSKKGKHNLDLGGLVIGKLINKINNEIINIIKEEKNTQNPVNSIKIKKLETLLSYYKSNVKNTYGCCSLITTISKNRIFPPINEYDIIGSARCSSEVMEKIDNEVKKRFTKFNKDIDK